ncbi:MAG: hypothetical protein JNM27_13615 [Leptospirales bacterium]|nr:hypothetical protein [Leptospirales bacterium]
MKNFRRGLILLFLLALTTCGPTGKEDAISAIPFMKEFVEQGSQSSPESLNPTRFSPLTGPILDRGFSSATYWYEFNAPHSGKENKQFIVFESLTLDRLEIYAAGNPRTQIAKLGDHFPRSLWPVGWSDFPTFPIESDRIYYIRLESTSLIKMPITIRTETNLRAFTERRVFLTAMYAGFILMLALAAALLSWRFEISSIYSTRPT